MMYLESVESMIRWLGGLLAYTVLGVVFYGIWHGIRRQPGRIGGRMGRYLRSPWFYLITSVLYFGVCYLGWIPLPLDIPVQVHFVVLVFGSLLYFPGMGLALWGRLAGDALANHRCVEFPSAGHGCMFDAEAAPIIKAFWENPTFQLDE